MTAYLVILAAYLLGAVPFGYLIARGKGVDLFRVGSGNIGATNVGRVLGRTWGLTVFALDFLKGAVPVLVSGLFADAAGEGLGSVNLLRVLVALSAFLGHLYPVYLGFRGGKGVATGAGTVMVLMPGPTAFALLLWLTVVSTTRLVSLGSVAAVLGLSALRLLSSDRPWEGDAAPLTIFCLGGTLLVIFKHLGNLGRIVRGTENRWPDQPIWQTMRQSIHLLAVGLWFGSAIFFNFLAAPAMNQSFQQTIRTAPNDRTAYLDVTRELDAEQKESLASALFGAAVGPLFPRFFLISGVCALLAFITALGWWSSGLRFARLRAVLLGVGLALVMISWPISQTVSALRLERFATDFEVARAAKSSFVFWHLLSLLLSAVTALIAVVAMALAAWLPGARPAPASNLP